MEMTDAREYQDGLNDTSDKDVYVFLDDSNIW